MYAPQQQLFVTIELTVNTVGSYLREHGVIRVEDEPDVDILGGGASNNVFRIETGDECLVVKQPLPDLAVDDHWPADISRIHNEAAAARTYGRIIDDTHIRAGRVPTVRFKENQDHVLAQECVPERDSVWKEQLLSGIIDRFVPRILGRILGAVQRETASDANV